MKGGSSLFALAVKVDAADLPAHLVKTDVVEPLEAGAVNRPDSVVRHEEVLLPPHKYVLSLVDVLDRGLAALARLLHVGAEGGKLGPVGDVNLLAGAPALVLRDEAVFRADDLALEVRRQGGMIVGQACVVVGRSAAGTQANVQKRSGNGRTLDLEVAAQERLAHVHVLDLHLDLVLLPFRLLGPDKPASRLQV